MKGNQSSLSAKISDLIKTGSKFRGKILQHLLPLFLTLPRRKNFKRMSQWGDKNETTYHNWFKADLNLPQFNYDLIKRHGSGEHFMIFDPSFISKSGKKTPSIGNFWSGGAGKSKTGLEMSCFAVGDLEQNTAYHFASTLTPSSPTLKSEAKTLIDYYVSQVKEHQEVIRNLGNCLVVDAYFGVSTFVNAVLALGIDVVSCLKSNACLYYVPKPVEGKRKPGRPPKKDGKINWKNLDPERLPIVEQNKDRIVRSALVYVECLKIQVLLVAVDYLKSDGSLRTRKLYFTTRKKVDFKWVLKRYKCRFQIEFLFRDGKQFTGLMDCQSTDLTKITNHLNLALTAVSVAKATHWQQDQPFSMKDITDYYHNLRMVELFSEALGLDPNSVQKNPKIITLLQSNVYDKTAA